MSETDSAMRTEREKRIFEEWYATASLGAKVAYWRSRIPLQPWQTRFIEAWERGGCVVLMVGHRQGQKALQRLLEDIHG